MLIGRTVCMLAALAVLAPDMACAQTWPSRPITAILPYPAGGSTDGVARLIAQELSVKLGQGVVIESKSGAGGTIAAGQAAKAPADGYHLFFYASAQAASPFLYKTLPYDPIADFTPIVLIGFMPQVIVTSAKLKTKTLPDLITYAKAHPGLPVGNSGRGTTGHIAAALLEQKAGLKFTHVFYRGTAPLVADVLASQIDVATPAFFPQAAETNVLAVTDRQRLDLLPNIPTAREAGIDIVSGLWLGLAGPAGLPQEIVVRINAIVNRYLNDPTFKSLATQLGMQRLGGTPEEMGGYIRNELDRLKAVYRDANITPDGG